MSLTSHAKNSATASAERSDKFSLHDAILGKQNSLNFLRLSLASLVIVAHSAPLVGFNAGILGIPVPEHIGTLGEWAVNMFFCISGFLIAHSAQRGTIAGYVKRRALRIFSRLLGIDPFCRFPVRTDCCCNRTHRRALLAEGCRRIHRAQF